MVIDGPWHIDAPMREVLLGFEFDGDDEAGDPSGIFVYALGWSLGVYWPMHRRVMVSWGIGAPFRFVRW
jgi:hypothetical protein